MKNCVNSVELSDRDNTEPSLDGNVLEGATARGCILADNNFPQERAARKGRYSLYLQAIARSSDKKLNDNIIDSERRRFPDGRDSGRTHIRVKEAPFQCKLKVTHNENSVNPKREHGNTEPSCRNAEGVETMYVASQSAKPKVDEDIVRSALKNAEAGRNGRPLRNESNKLILTPMAWEDFVGFKVLESISITVFLYGASRETGSSLQERYNESFIQ